MLNILNFLIFESIRQGLPHISTMSHEQLTNLTKDGKVHLHNLTEKTDGQSHKFGYDEHGFYTQSTGSGNEKMRSSEDYHNRAKRRAEETGKPLDLTAAKAFGHIHDVLHKNEALQKHLKGIHEKTGKEVSVRGETFYRPWGKPGDHEGETKFVATSYATHHMGKVGKYVIHSQLPENQHHDLEHFKKHLSNDEMNFDDDKLEHEKKSVDVSKESEELKGVNHELLKTRKNKNNAEAKDAEQKKVEGIAKRISDKVDSHVKEMGLQKKWGSGSEGVVVHPSSKNPEAPRFKVTSDAFRDYRASDAAKNFKKSKPVNEATEQEHHATVIPLTGFSPISHMGHAHDLGSAMSKLPGEKHIGISAKSDVYTGEERANILKRQWKDKAKDLHTHVTNSGGEVVSNAFHALPKHGKKVLHLLVGHDRKDFADKLKSSLEAGKIKEMNGHHWDEIHIHHPEDTDRSHGMSGTKMRTAVANGDREAFHKHLGNDFSKKESDEHFDKIKGAIDSGKLEVNRPAAQPKTKKVKSLKEIYEMILEGGNVKIGDVGADDLKITKKNRQEHKSDIHNMLKDIHNSFKKEHGIELFGKDAKALHTGSAYSGSTTHLMNDKVSDEEFAKHKSKVGDVDVKVPTEHHEKVVQHLTPGKKFGKYSVVGIKKSGSEAHALMRHENGQVHQVDFEKSHYEHDEPTEGDKFAHSSSWEDTKAGIKGVHHKMLINAAGGETHKFSITHGLRSRTDENDKGVQHPTEITHKLFGKKADAEKIHSFHGVADLIAKHIPAEKHQEIYDKFADSVSKKKGIDHSKALDVLKSKLKLNHDEAKLTKDGLDTDDLTAIKADGTVRTDKPRLVDFKTLDKEHKKKSKMPKIDEEDVTMNEAYKYNRAEERAKADKILKLKKSSDEECSDCGEQKCDCCCDLSGDEVDDVVNSATDDDFADVYDNDEFTEINEAEVEEILGEELNDKHLDVLKSIIDKVKMIDPMGSDFKRFQEHINKLSDSDLEKIKNKNIRYLSTMAKLKLDAKKMHVKESEELVMEVLSREERIRSAAKFALTQAKRDRKRQIALHRFSSGKVLSKRARRMAVNLLKKRLSRGKDIAKLSVGEKERLEARISKMKNTVARIAVKLSSRIRKIEKDRMSHQSVTKE